MPETQLVLSLPRWFIYTGIIGGFLVSIFQAIKYVYLFFRRSTLEVRLTREIFFRLTDQGETVFLNGVLLAKHGPVEIRKVECYLTKTNEAIKKYAISPQRFGQKVLNMPIANFCFYTDSPISFLAENMIDRPVLFAVFSQYHKELAKQHQDFLLEISKRADKIRINPHENNKAFQDEIINLEKTFTSKILDKIQLEDGNFRVDITVRYKPIKGFGFGEKEAKSAITFTVGPGFREQYRVSIEQNLTTQANKAIFGKVDTPTLPEYNPSDVLEI